MGWCMGGGGRVQIIENEYARQNRAASQSAAQPRQFATGDTLIPFNFMTGAWCKNYPVWFDQDKISQTKWSEFIKELNETTEELASEATQSALEGDRKLMHSALEIGEMRAHQTETRQRLINDTNQVLLKWNKELFREAGFVCHASFGHYARIKQGGPRNENVFNFIGFPIDPEMGVVFKEK